MAREAVDGDHPNPSVDLVERARPGPPPQVGLEGADFAERFRVIERQEVLGRLVVRVPVDLRQPPRDVGGGRRFQPRLHEDAAERVDVAAGGDAAEGPTTTTAAGATTAPADAGATTTTAAPIEDTAVPDPCALVPQLQLALESEPPFWRETKQFHKRAAGFTADTLEWLNGLTR